MISAKFVPLKYYTLSSQLPCSTVECSGRRIRSPGQIAIVNQYYENSLIIHVALECRNYFCIYEPIPNNVET